MTSDTTDREHPGHERLRALYDQTGIGGKTYRRFGVDFRILTQKPFGNAWLDRHLRHLKLSVSLQLAALVIAMAGLVWWLFNSPGRTTASVFEDWPFVVALVVAIALVVWSLLRLRRARAAFLKGKRP